MSDVDARTLHIAAALQLNLAAAFATVIGGLTVFNTRLLRLASPMALATTLSISGGVTVFLSLVLLLSFGVMDFGVALVSDDLDQETVIGQAWLASTITFTVGVLIVYAVDFTVKKLTPGVDPERPMTPRGHGQEPSIAHTTISSGEHGFPNDGTKDDRDSPMLESPHDATSLGDFIKMDEGAKQKLQSMGILSGIAIALHNIPSGMGTFVAGAEHPDVGMSMVIGIAMHNLAEGVAIAAPVYFATGSKWKGVMWCVLAMLAEHVGGFIAFAVIGTEVNEFSLGAFYSLVAGMMATICMTEIFPTAYMYANGRIQLVANGSVAGMVIMAVSLVGFMYMGV